MATATETETKPNVSETFLEVYKATYKESKEACPCCNKKVLHTNDSDKFDDIMHYACIGCGHTFYEDEQSRKWRKEKKKKDKNKNPWDMGFLILLMMLAATLAIQANDNRVSDTDTQPVNSQPIDVRPVNSESPGIRQVN
ncbi:MAG: hypothetical protein AB8B99_00240 [Phormidesmis sp.]